MLSLLRPLVIFDTETTGIVVTKDKIVQLAVIKIFPDGSLQEKMWMINPGCLIPEAASRVHKITNEMVDGQPCFEDLSLEIADIFKDSDVGGYNAIKFDVPLLKAEFDRIQIQSGDEFSLFEEVKEVGSWSLEGVAVIDPFVIFKREESRKTLEELKNSQGPKGFTLTDAVEFYCHSQLEGAHDALYDARATYEVLCAQLKCYPSYPRDPQTLYSLCRDGMVSDRIFFKDSVSYLNFGRYKGQAVREVFSKDPSYIYWFLKQDILDQEKAILEEVIS